MKSRPTRWRVLVALLAAALVLAACGDDDTAAPTSGETGTDASSTSSTTGGSDVTLTLLTHDSFNVSDDTLKAFTDQTGIEVDVLQGGDAGAVVNQAILSKDNPQADVLFGVDNTFLSRALGEDLFVPYQSPALDGVDPSVVLDDQHRVTPIDTGDVCLNYDKSGLADAGLEPPTSLQDLTAPEYAGTLVVENPATSSPGLAFLLATIDAFGQDGWQQYWKDLRANDVEVTDGWEDAYYGSFSGSADSSGDRPLVVSYATSPPAEVIYAEQPLDEAPTGVIVDSCYRQIEFAGILSGTEHEAEARKLIDFMLSPTFQSDIPLTMFVYPVTDVDLPEEFVKYGAKPDDPYQLDADLVAQHRDDWIEEWTQLVLR